MSDRRGHSDASDSRLPPQPGPYPPPGDRIPEELVDRFFDRQLDAGERAALFAQLRAQPARAREVVQTQQILAELDDPIFGPDLTGPVLDRVHRRRAFLPSGWRRVVTAGRALVAVCVLATIGGVALLERYAPELTLDDRPTPVSRMITSGPERVVENMGSVVDAGRSLFDGPADEARSAAAGGVVTAGLDSSGWDSARRGSARWDTASVVESQVVLGEPSPSVEVVRFDTGSGRRVWTVDAPAVSRELRGSGAWAPSPASVLVTAGDAYDRSMVRVRYSGSATMRVSFHDPGPAAAFSACSVDADPYTMRVGSLPGVDLDLAVLRLVPMARPHAEVDTGIGGLRLVRTDRTARAQSRRR